MPTPAVKTDSPFWQLPVAALLEQLAASPDGLSSAAAAARLPFTSAGAHLGFVAPPAFFFLILAAILLFYLLAVEGMKQWFFRRFAAE